MRTLERLMAIFRKRSLDTGLEQELAAHVDLAAAELERAGHSPAEARRLALARLGGLEASKETHRDARGVPWLETVIQDVKVAARGLRRTPGFTIVAVAIMAIGIGANTAVYTVVSPLLVRPLPFREPERLVWMEKTANEGDLSSRTYQVAMYEEVRRRSRSFETITAYFPFFGYASYTLTGRGEPEKLQAVDLATNFFDTLGVRPMLGRGFREADGHENAPRTAILSYRYWQRRLGANPAVVGQTLTLNGESYTIAGVSGPDFDFTSTFMPSAQAELYVPARLERMRNWGNTLFFIGRLKPGVTLGQASKEMAALKDRIGAENKAIFGLRPPMKLEPLHEHVSGGLSRSLTVLWCAVGVVLMVVCANLANLMLARTAARGKELAVRAALGAGRLRLARQLLTEGLVVAALGASFGVPLAWLATRYLHDAAAVRVPMLHQMHLDGGAMAFTALLVALTGAVIGLAPLPMLPKTIELAGDMRDSSRSATAGRRHGWLRSGLVVAEISLAFVLLAGAGLLLRSFVRLLDVDLGFNPANAVAIPANLPPDPGCGTPEICFGRRRAKVDEVLRLVRAIPGVETAAFTDAFPLGRNRSWGLARKGQQFRPGESSSAFVYIVGPEFFQAMGIPFLAGRAFTEQETRDNPEVGSVIVNRTAARELWPGQDAVGKLAVSGQRTLQVVGVVADTRQSSLDADAGRQMYLPYGPRYGLAADLVVRGKLPPAAISAGVREALRPYDPRIVAAAYRPIEDLVNVSVSPRRFLLTLIAGFAGIALLLAALGIYGVVSYSVGQLVREIGIRIALGADPRALRWRIVGGTALLGLAGVALGTAAGLFGGRLIAAMLFATRPNDPIVFGITGATLLGATVLAGYLPALRASRVDPAIALRNE